MSRGYQLSGLTLCNKADAAHKFGLIKAAANKGPKAIQAATETAAKAAKRRDSFAKKLEILGVNLKD